MRPATVAFFILCTLLLPGAASPAAVQRFALVAGANDGGPDRPTLKYAVADAERFARVLVDLGGVSPANAILLKQPKLRELEQALDALRSRIDEGRRAAAGNGGGRTEVLVYDSGHADEKGLLLGEDRYSYRSLRDRLDDVAADVRIAVLDACASGAITRIKGGRLRPPFLVDESADMRGERLALLCLGCLADRSASAALGQPTGTLLTGVAYLIGVASLATAVHRTVWIARRLRTEPPPAGK